MEAYERATQKPEHDLRPMSETDLPQEVHFDTKQGKVLFTGLSEQDTHNSMQGEESKKGSKGRKKRVLEGRHNYLKPIYQANDRKSLLATSSQKAR